MKETHDKRTETHASDLISRRAAIDALWKALFEYEDDAEKQFQESDELDVSEWTVHRIFVQTMSDIDRQTIRNLPSAQPEQQWIPCSERMPEDCEEVNVTCVNHDPEPYYDFTKDKPFTAPAVYYKEKWYWYSITCADFLAEYGENWYEKIDDGIEIIAWMPLPEPYTTRDRK